VAQGVPGRLRPQIFLTFRHYKGGRSSAKRTRRLYSRRNPSYSLPEAESTSGHMVLSGLPQKTSPVTPSGIDPGTVQLVAQRLNHYATPDPFVNTIQGSNQRNASFSYLYFLLLKNETTKDNKVLSVFYLSGREQFDSSPCLAASAGTGMLRVAEKGVAGTRGEGDSVDLLRRVTELHV